MIYSRKLLKRMGDRKHSFVTPTVVLKQSPVQPFIWTGDANYICVEILHDGL